MYDKQAERDLERAKILIQAKQYEEAKAILITIDSPEADRMLNRLNEMKSVNPSEKNALILLLIWFFLGLLGFHRFYSGHIGIGIVQFLTVGGMGIWWFIDGVIILTGGYTDSQGNPIKF